MQEGLHSTQSLVRNFIWSLEFLSYYRMKGEGRYIPPSTLITRTYLVLSGYINAWDCSVFQEA